MHLLAISDRSAAVTPESTATIRQGTFRSAVQPLVQAAAEQGASVSEVTRILRERYGRAYRRVDLLADLRRYRGLERGIERGTIAIARLVDPRRYIAQAGVAVFGVSMLIPSLLHGASNPLASANVIVAATVDVPAIVEHLLPPPPDPVATIRLAPEPEPFPAAPAPEPPTAPPPSALATTAPAPIVVRATPRPATVVPLSGGGLGIEYVASWYGPGFFENRLPCWQWLQAHRQPIQFLPDTWGIAHKTLPCGSMVTLIHGANVVTVPVVDRGPYIEGREFDLSPRVKAALGCTDLCTVVMQIR